MHKTALKKFCLFPFVLLVWFPLWFLLMGTLTGSEELATINPALSGSGQAAWTLHRWLPTLGPAVNCCWTHRNTSALLEHLPADISAVGWSIGRGCSCRMGTLPLEISRAGAVRGLYCYF